MTVQRREYLTPPQVSPDHIREKITCIRAHRERIFQVYNEKLREKTVFHNYGHGGAGWTFLFGAVQESLRQLKERNLPNAPICVIGAGCYGLLTAVSLAHQGYRVRIVAKELYDLPSYKAAGFFFPRARKCSNEHEREIFRSYGVTSYTTYISILNGEHPFIRQGASILPAYYGLDIDPGFADYIKQSLMPSPEKVTIDFGTGKHYEAMRYYSLFIKTTQIMEELHREINDLSIPIIKAELSCFDEVEESIIFNCSGLGARNLTSDKRIIPVQGHLITLHHQPPIEQLQYMINVKVLMKSPKGTPRDELIYYAPKDEGILGITFIRGQEDPHANLHEFDRLLERTRTFFGT